MHAVSRSEPLEPRTTIVFSQVQNIIEYRAGCIAARYTRFRGAAYMREAAWKTLQRSVRSLAKFLFIDRSGISCGPGEFFLFSKYFFLFSFLIRWRIDSKSFQNQKRKSKRKNTLNIPLISLALHAVYMLGSLSRPDRTS